MEYHHLIKALELKINIYVFVCGIVMCGIERKNNHEDREEHEDNI